jgi:IMP dehydrogenase
MAELDIGKGKSARRAWGLDEIAIVPSRRTRDPEQVDLSWEIDAFRFDLPFMSAATDSVTSPATAIEMGRLGGVGVLNLEGLWTRHDDPDACLQRIAALDDADVPAAFAELYAEPIRPELVVARIAEINAAGVVSCAAVSPQRTELLAPYVVEAELDLLVIQGTVVSAEHVSRGGEPLNLKQFIRSLDMPVIVGGCASYQAARHLMQTGAAGVLVGVGPGQTSTTKQVLGVGVPQATAIADVRAARMRHLDETGVYVHVIAAGGMPTGGDVAKAVVCGADAVMLGSPLAAATDAPGRGWHWGMSAAHATLPRGVRVPVTPRGTLEQLVTGPARDHDGRVNLAGALATSMAACGYNSVKDFQTADLVVTLSSEGGPSDGGADDGAGDALGLL